MKDCMKDSIIAVKIIRKNLRNPSIKISYIINSFFNAKKQIINILIMS